MEIAEQLRRLGAKALLLLLLPLLVGVAAFYLQAQKPPQFSSSATVLTPPAATQRTGAQYIGDFQAALKADSVGEKVAKEAGVSSGDVLDGLSAKATSAGSTVLEVTWTGENRAAAAKVPSLAAREAFTLLVTPRISALKTQETAGLAQYDAANKARDDYTKEIEVALPPQAYQSALQEVTQLNAAYQTALANGSDTAPDLKESLASSQEKLDTLAPTVNRYNQLQSDVDRTYAALTQVRNDLAEVQAQLTSAGDPGTITAGPVTRESATVPLIRNVVGAAVVGFGVALALLLLFGALFGRPRYAPPSGRRVAAPVVIDPWDSPPTVVPSRREARQIEPDSGAHTPGSLSELYRRP